MPEKNPDVKKNLKKIIDYTKRRENGMKRTVKILTFPKNCGMKLSTKKMTGKNYAFLKNDGKKSGSKKKT